MTEFYKARLKYACLSLMSKVFYPWINDLGVRVYTHFKDPKEFHRVLAMAKHARANKQEYIMVDKPTEPEKPKNTIKIAYMHNHSKKSKKK